MGFRVNRRTLLLIAGCVWIIAGINILRIGIVTWLNDAHYWLFKVGEAIVVFLLFFQFVFRRLFVKHYFRRYDPPFPIASQLLYFGLLHRTFVCPDYYRHPIPDPGLFIVPPELKGDS